MRDLQNTYSDAQAITPPGDTNSTNIVDQLAAGDAFEPAFLFVGTASVKNASTFPAVIAAVPTVNTTL